MRATSRTAHSARAAPCSCASSTANGKRVSPAPTMPLPALIAALVHSASSRSAGCTCVPSCVARARNRDSALPAPPHACTSVR